MATIKLSTTKSASRLINYAEKKAVVKDGYNLDIDYAKTQMKQTRELFSKNDGIQAHHVIQSFKPGEVSPEKANKIGLELAEKLAKNHEVAVYTHADTDHIHNHIVINSVNFETGKKYQAHGIEAIEHARSLSDEICKSHDLSIVKQHKSNVRHTLAEQEILKKGQSSWKDEIRQAVNFARQDSTSFDDFRHRLENDYDIKIHLRGEKTITFEHPNGKRVRGNRLGHDYERVNLENEFTRQVKREQKHERTVSRNEETERIDDELYKGSDERRNGERSHDSQSIEPDTRNIRRDNKENALDIERAREDVERKHRSFAKDFDRWTRKTTRNYSNDSKSNRETSRTKQHVSSRDTQRTEHEHEGNKSKHRENRTKRRTKDIEISL